MTASGDAGSASSPRELLGGVRVVPSILSADFGLDDLTVEFSGARLGSGSSGFLVTMPHRDRTAGFFIARLRRS